jgi:uncharacterized protein YfaS (alpha-2-macroglobulin family)
MKKIVLFLCLAVSAFAISYVPSFNKQTKAAMSFLMPEKPMNTYAAEWKKVTDAQNKGLTEDALKIVEAIYSKAKGESNTAQIVKALYHIALFNNYKQEDATNKNIARFESELTTAQFPLKHLLHNILGQLYWNYYTQQRWQIMQRSNTADFKKDDVATYSAKDLVDVSLTHFLESVKGADSTQKVKIDFLEPTLYKGDVQARKLRPTLFEFLAFQAVGFFTSAEADVTRPADQFDLNEDVYLKPYTDFIKTKITNRDDKYALKYYALSIYQKIEQNLSATTNKDALLDAQLQRLRFVYNNSVNPTKEAIYMKTLKQVVEEFPTSYIVSEYSFAIASSFHQSAASYDPYGDTTARWHNKSAIEWCNFTMAKFPKTIGSSQAQILKNDILRPSQSIVSEEANEPLKPFRLLVNYQNTNQIYYKILKVDFDEYEKQKQNYESQAKLLKYLNAATVVKSGSQALPLPKDFQAHSTEIKIESLPNGFYVIQTSISKTFTANNNIINHAAFFNSNIAYLYDNSGNGGKLIVAHRQSGEPIANAKVQIYAQIYDYTTSRYKKQLQDVRYSDKNGLTDLSGLKYDQGNFTFKIYSGEDFIFSNSSYYFNNSGDVKEYTAEVSHFFTDRAIYRPSQTVYFKAILTTKTGNSVDILTKKSTVVTLFDANYQKIQDVNLVSNEFGSVAGQFNIPVGLLTGNYSIGNGSGSVSFSVEEYKRPTFEVNIDPIKGEFNLNDKIAFKGKALAYNGSVISGAKVKYKVTRQANFPYYDYYYFRCFPIYNSEPTQIAFGEVLSNDTGGFEIPFTAIPDKKLSKDRKPYFTYSVSADVTDINGETRSASNSVSIGYQSLILDISTDERIDKSDTVKVNVTAQNVNGEELDVNIKWKVYPLKHHGRLLRERYWEKTDQFVLSEKEYLTAFPNDIYKEEDDWHTWPKQAAIFDKQGATKNGNLEILNKEIKDLPVGNYAIEVSAIDKNGEAVTVTKHIAVSDYNKGELSHPELDHFQFINPNAEPGQVSSYRWVSPMASPYLVLIERPNQPYNLSWSKATNALTDLSILESDRGGVYVSTQMVRLGRFYSNNHSVSVPFSNKDLNIKFSTFRNKLLPGEKETWQMIIKDKENMAANAEMLATLYDASLDAFRANWWYMNLYDNFYKRFNLTGYYFGQTNGEQMTFINEKNIPFIERRYDGWNDFGSMNNYGGYGYSGGGRQVYRMLKKDGNTPEPMMAMSAAPEMKMDKAEDSAMEREEAPKGIVSGLMKQAPVEKDKPLDQTSSESGGGIVTRKNFNETAFFYPQLKTNDKGELVVSFTMPEALTKWKMLGIAHTKDLKFARIQNELVTQKDLMIQANAPRFLRENDEIYFSAKVSNLTDKALSGVATLEILDAFTMQPVSAKFDLTTTNQNFSCAAKLNAALAWKIKVPEGLVQAIVYRVTAKSGNFSDGEENSLPILSDKMLVTESMPLYINGKGSKTYSFAKLLEQNNHSTTLKNHSFTVEFSSNPAWYAVQALPYLMEYPHECAEQTFSRLYANALASHVVNSKPKIKQVFEAWKNYTPESFLSNLQKNEELKQVILQETPWVMQAANEADRKKNVGLLFDLNKMSNELSSAVNQLKKMQLPNGAFPWFNGMLEDRYITQLIIGGFGKLNKIGVNTYAENIKVNAMINNAIQYCDKQIDKDFDEIKKYDKDYKKNNHNSAYIIQYLYARSFYKDVAINSNSKDAFDYFLKQCNDYWLGQSRSVQGLSALVLQRNGKVETAKAILKSLSQNALFNDEMGMYWKENYGYYWYQAPIETQALMIEAFDEINGDINSVNLLKQWLLKSKQTQDWKTTRATSDAVYALLLKGDDWLDTEPNIEIQVGDVKLKPGKDANIKAEAGTGYFKYTFRNDEVKPNMGNIKIEKSKNGIAWGAVYWQYFEKLDKITSAETPLQLKKQVFIVENNKEGEQIKPVSNNNELKIGDKLKVRIELHVDRDMEYVHMKDMRAAGFEPVNVLSASKYQDGLNYYESTKDAATHFFFGYLRKGVYVFEYPLFVTHNGDFSNGVTTIQCMYAPEFTSHSEGIRVKVK